MIETSAQSFKDDVIDPSMQIPVIVDFWAPWCAPCKSLGPTLEKLEQAYGGRFKLVKVNSDDEQQLSAHFKVKSLPTVFAVVGGRIVDQFQGALPEGKIREFIDRLMPNPADIETDLAFQAIEAGDQPKAMDHAKKAISLDPRNDAARLLYAQLLLQANEPAAAQAQMDALSSQAKLDPQSIEIAQAIAAAVQANQLPPNPALEAKIAANPMDWSARLEMAQYCMEYKAWEQALTQLLEIVKKDRTFQEDIGRKKMIEIFDLASAQPDLVGAWRRKLSAAIF
jgi:putative thioredoxin